MICGGVQEEAEGAVLQFECRVFIAGVLEGVAGKSSVERVEGTDEDEDIVWQIAILGSSGSGAHVRHALVVAAAFGKLLLAAGLHFHVGLGGDNPSTQKRARGCDVSPLVPPKTSPSLEATHCVLAARTPAPLGGCLPPRTPVGEGSWGAALRVLFVVGFRQSFFFSITREKMKSSVKVRRSHCFCSSASVSILPPLLGSHIY